MPNLNFEVTRVEGEFLVTVQLEDEMPVVLSYGDMQRLENELVRHQLIMIQEGYDGSDCNPRRIS